MPRDERVVVALVAVAIVSFAAAAVLYHERRGRRHKALLIVDCGSGATRARVFWRDRKFRIRQQEAGEYAGLSEKWSQPKIVDALVEGGSVLDGWVAGIQALIEATGCHAAIVGATGGLRAAEASGLVSRAMIGLSLIHI